MLTNIWLWHFRLKLLGQFWHEKIFFLLCYPRAVVWKKGAKLRKWREIPKRLLECELESSSHISHKCLSSLLFPTQISFFLSSYIVPLTLISILYVGMLIRLWHSAPGSKVSAESRRGKKRVTRMVVFVVLGELVNLRLYSYSNILLHLFLCWCVMRSFADFYGEKSYVNFRQLYMEYFFLICWQHECWNISTKNIFFFFYFFHPFSHRLMNSFCCMLAACSRKSNFQALCCPCNFFPR